MGLGLNSLFKGKQKAAGANPTQVKKNTQTTDSIISQAVSQAGNISNLTLSKEEHAQMLDNRHQVPAFVVLLKYTALTLFVVAIVLGLLLKADLDPRNQYLGLLGLSDNTGSKYVKLSQEKNILETETTKLTNEIDSLQTRQQAFDDAQEDEKVALLVPEVLKVQSMQRRWFNQMVAVLDENGDPVINPESKEVIMEKKFGLVDSFNNMIEYFEDKHYQPRFFTEKNRNESLNRSEPDVCNIADHRLQKRPQELARKKQFQSAGRCLNPSTLIMANEIEMRGLSISDNSVSVNVTASDLLSRVFTVSSEFVAMMNSFPFYQGAEISNFSRRDEADGGDSSEISLRLEFQSPDEEDPYDQYLMDLVTWQNQKK